MSICRLIFADSCYSVSSGTAIPVVWAVLGLYIVTFAGHIRPSALNAIL